jgi:hypothetical protein
MYMRRARGVIDASIVEKFTELMTEEFASVIRM